MAPDTPKENIREALERLDDTTGGEKGEGAAFEAASIVPESDDGE